jgi:hypothetical protein
LLADRSRLPVNSVVAFSGLVLSWKNWKSAALSSRRRQATRRMLASFCSSQSPNSRALAPNFTRVRATTPTRRVSYCVWRQQTGSGEKAVEP